MVEKMRFILSFFVVGCLLAAAIPDANVDDQQDVQTSDARMDEAAGLLFPGSLIDEIFGGLIPISDSYVDEPQNDKILVSDMDDSTMPSFLSTPATKVTPEVLATHTLLDGLFGNFFGGGILQPASSADSTTVTMMSTNNSPMTITVSSSSGATPDNDLFADSSSVMDFPFIFGDDFFGGLFDNGMADMLMRLRPMDELPGLVSVSDDFGLNDATEPVHAHAEPMPVPLREQLLVDDLEDMREQVEQLEQLKALSDESLAASSWGVNAAQLRAACMDTFEALCPDSVPDVFYRDIDEFPPPGPHMGLAPGPAHPDASCWMKCADDHKEELPFECRVSADRMVAWSQVHSEDAFLGDPQMMLIGALVHFLIMALLVLTCVRCTCLCLKMRRRRRQAGNVLAGKKTRIPIVSAITIQIPPVANLPEEGYVAEATVVTGTPVV